MKQILATSILCLALAYLAAGQGGPCVRRDVTILSTDSRYEAEWSLLVQALARQKGLTRTDATSYFKAASIHWEPREQFLNIPIPGGTSVGYCAHSNDLFPTWHRPYVRLIELGLRRQALIVARQYPQSMQSAYVAAAENLCFPYWDYAGPDTERDGIPSVLYSSTVSIMRTNGQRGAVTNPFRSYTFPRGVRGGRTTSRYGGSTQQLVTGTRQFATEQRDNFFTTLLQPSWSCFSRGQGQQCVGGSLEGVHNSAHVQGGGGGELAQVSWAGFDPVFWLLHCNVDRHFALYQELNPNVWLTDGTRLRPFKRTANFQNSGDTNGFSDLYNSDQTRDFRAMGFTYDDLEGNPSPAALADRLAQRYRLSDTTFNRLATLASVDSTALFQAARRQRAASAGRRKLLKNYGPPAPSSSCVEDPFQCSEDELVFSLEIHCCFKTEGQCRRGCDGYVGSLAIWTDGRNIPETPANGGFYLNPVMKERGIDIDCGPKDAKAGPASGPARMEVSTSDLSFSVEGPDGFIEGANIGRPCLGWYYAQQTASNKEGQEANCYEPPFQTYSDLQCSDEYIKA